MWGFELGLGFRFGGSNWGFCNGVSIRFLVGAFELGFCVWGFGLGLGFRNGALNWGFCNGVYEVNGGFSVGGAPRRYLPYFFFSLLFFLLCTLSFFFSLAF